MSGHSTLGWGRSPERCLQVRGFQNTQCQIVGSAPTGAQTQAVKLWRGDEMREAEHLPFPNAVKIDVEGYEYLVVQGLKETLSHRSCRLLCCEVHPSRLPVGVRLEQVIEVIEACGFSRIEKFERGTEVHLVCTKQERNDGPS